MTKYHELVAYKYSHLFLTVWRLAVQDQHAITVRFWWEPTSWFLDGVFLLSHTWQKGKGALGGLLYESLIPIMRALPSWPKYLSQTPPPNAILGIRVSTNEFWEDTSIQIKRKLNLLPSFLIASTHPILYLAYLRSRHLCSLSCLNQKTLSPTSQFFSSHLAQLLLNSITWAYPYVLSLRKISFCYVLFF